MSRYTVELLVKATEAGVAQVLGGTASGLGQLGQAATNALGTLAGNLASAAITKVLDLGRAIGDSLINEAPALEQVQRSFANLAAGAGQSAGEVLSSMREASRGMITDADLMTSYNEAMLLVGDSMADQFPALLNIASASAAATGQDVGFMLDSLVKGIGRASPMILDNLGLTINMSEVMDAYAATLGKSSEELTKAEQQTALLNAVTAQGADFAARLGDNTGGAALSVGQLKTTMTNLKDQAVMALLPALAALLGPLGELATAYGPQIIAWATEAGQWLGTNIPVAIGMLQAIWMAVFPQIQAAMVALQTTTGTVWPFIQNLIGQVVGWVSANMPLIIAAAQAIADFWTGTLQPVTVVVWQAIQALIGTVLTAVLGIVKAALAVIAGDWNTAWAAVGEVTAEIWQAIKTVINTVLQTIAIFLGTTLAEIKATWEGNFAMLWDIVRAIFDRIMGFLRGINLRGIGRDIISGLVNGIKSGAGAVVGALKDIVNQAIESAKNLLGSHSDSRVFIGIGKDVSSGFARGIMDGSRWSEDAVGGMVDGVVNASYRRQQSVVIYGGVDVQGVQDGASLVGQLQAMSI